MSGAILDDNARKFTLTPINPTLLTENNVSSYLMIVDWLETSEDDEKKLAYKKFDNGDIKILLIAKVTTDGNRTSEKTTLSEDEYKELLSSSTLHLEKHRYEFTYTQNGATFDIKYDEFADGKLCILEVDAPSEAERAGFDPSDFPTELTEVTGDLQYYGYRVAHIL